MPKNNFVDLTGKRFGMLVVVSVSKQPRNTPAVLWDCACECGGTVVRQSAELNLGVRASCGCASVINMMSRAMVEVIGSM